MKKIIKKITSLILFVLGVSFGAQAENTNGPVVLIRIDGTINPATNDFLTTSLAHAEKVNAKLFVMELNTPGGVLASTQIMVESLLGSKVPTVVYVSPSGGGAMSAGVFITLAGHVAAMAPGSTIGAAHPVSGGGKDVEGDMRKKVENFAATLIKAIAEQRGRNIEWAEKAVRESVAITDREAVEKKVVDFTSDSLPMLLGQIEGRSVTLKDKSVVKLSHLKDAPLETLQMTFKQQVVNFLSDPNIAILLGLGAMLGLGIELYHPGAVLPGIVGVICLVLSLTAGQVLPINTGGAALLGLSAVFFVVEAAAPSFGIWGIAGTICLVLGSIYFIDADAIWGTGLGVNPWMIGSIAAAVGIILLSVLYLMVKTNNSKVTTGKEGLVGSTAKVKTTFERKSCGRIKGRVSVHGELWKARIESASENMPQVGEEVFVSEVDGLELIVKTQR